MRCLRSLREIMRKLLLILTIAALFYAVSCSRVAEQLTRAENAFAPKSNAGQTAPIDDDAPRITLADAKKEYDAGSAVIIDVRAESAYKAEHIKGALNITIETLAADLNKIPKGKKIIAYCS